MNFDLKTLQNEINKLMNEMPSYNSSKLVYNYFRLIELIDFYNCVIYKNIDARESVSAVPMGHINDYNYNLNAKTTLSLFNNKEFYRNFTRTICSTISDYQVKSICLEELKEKDSLNLIREFLKNFDVNLLDYFDYMVDKSKINFGKIRVNISYSGLTTLYSKNPYIVCNQQRLDIISLSTIMHELGHVINRIKTKNYSYERLLLIPSSLYEEVTPMFLEKLFIKYLIDNNIFKKEATYLNKDGLIELKEYAKLLHIISNIDNISYDNGFHLKTSNRKLRDLLKDLDTPYQMYPIAYLKNLNVKEIIRYFYGIMLGLEYVYDYTGNSKDIYDFSKNMDLIDDDQVNKLLKKSKILIKEADV